MSGPVGAPAILPLDFSLRPAAPLAPLAQGPAIREPLRDAGDRWTPSAALSPPPVQRERPMRGPSISADLGDGWRLEGSASFKGRGTVRVGLRGTF